jgi:succinate dehydrogenase / fumarate reductase cytochrome b subunit
MIVSGIVVLVFVPVHIWGFKYGADYDAPEEGVRDLHRLVVETFEQPGWVFFYCLAMAIIGVHLWHGFGSAFESLGLPYRNIVRRSGQALAVIIAGGFFLIPLILFFSSRGGGQP